MAYEARIEANRQCTWIERREAEQHAPFIRKLIQQAELTVAQSYRYGFELSFHGSEKAIAALCEHVYLPTDDGRIRYRAPADCGCKEAK